MSGRRRCGTRSEATLYSARTSPRGVACRRERQGSLYSQRAGSMGVGSPSLGHGCLAIAHDCGAPMEVGPGEAAESTNRGRARGCGGVVLWGCTPADLDRSTAGHFLAVIHLLINLRYYFPLLTTHNIFQKKKIIIIISSS
jgi:hypothetical protein